MSVIAFIACMLLFQGEITLLSSFGHHLERLTDFVGDRVGPVPFFIAYALLPVVGVSLWFFNFTAGVVFVERIGIVWVLVFAAIAIATANALSYWLARTVLRPLAEKLVKRLGYKMPNIPPDEHVSATILLRVVPGLPYIVQSYVPGLANVRFVPYMIVSFIVRFGWAIATIMLGRSYKALTEDGSFKAIVAAVVLLIVLVIGTRWARKYYARKSKSMIEPRA